MRTVDLFVVKMVVHLVVARGEDKVQTFARWQILEARKKPKGFRFANDFSG